jgi:hypothetical protein
VFTTVEEILYDETWVQELYRQIVRQMPDRTGSTHFKVLNAVYDRMWVRMSLGKDEDVLQSAFTDSISEAVFWFRRHS